MSAAVQTLWAELIAATLADAGVTTCVVSPGSRSTPLVAALAADGRFELPTIIHERAAAFVGGPPPGSALPWRAVRRKFLQAVTAARGPRPGPVQLEIPRRKPLEPAAPSTDEERALAKVVAELRRTDRKSTR